MATKVLKDATVENAKAPAGGRLDLWDKTLPGFGVRVSGDMKTWMVLIRPTKGAKPTRRKLGTYPAMSLEAARDKARKWKSYAHDGIDPSVVEQQEKAAAAEATRLAEAERIAQQENAFGLLAKRFIDEYAKPELRPGTVVEYERALTR